MLPNQITLLGGGSSIRYLGAIDNGLFTFLQDKFTIGINYSYKFVNTTCNLGIDETLYNDPIHHEEIKNLPLWIGKEHKSLKQRETNSIFLKPSKKYDRDLKEGVYRASLSGIFALSLVIKLLNASVEGIKNQPEIYLLGYDYSPYIKDGKVLLDSQGKPISHWYQEEFRHRGTGKVSWYNQTGEDKINTKRAPYADLEFRPFKDESKVKIYNVGGTSRIPHFEHISYDRFFRQLFNKIDSQDKVRKELKELLWQIKQENNI